MEIAFMRISELAKHANVNIETIRYYEREGLLPPPKRSANRYREYGNRDLEQVLVIRSSRDLGFTVEEVRDILQLHRVLASREPGPAPKQAAQGRMLEAADRQLSMIEEKLRALGQMKQDLLSLVDTLKNDARPVCPVSKLSMT
jgi:MerR family copper efflux transcriptional regulator